MCQAANPRKQGPCRCTPCRQLQVQMRSLCIYGSEESTVCFDKRKRVGRTAALPTVAVWERTSTRLSPGVKTKVARIPLKRKESPLGCIPRRSISGIWSNRRSLDLRSNRVSTTCKVTWTLTLSDYAGWLMRGQAHSATPSLFDDFGSVSEAWEELAEDEVTDWDACSRTTGFPPT